MRNIVIVATALAIGCIVNSCRLIDYMDRPRPIVMKCKISDSTWVTESAAILDRNGYYVYLKDYSTGEVEACDTIRRVAYPYSLLVRTWHIKAFAKDSVVINCWSISTRLDDSDVTQTWDRRSSAESVKEWMRPVLTSMEAVCGLGSPIKPSGM